MAEPGLPDSAFLPENPFHAERVASAGESLMAELSELRSQVRGQIERIHHLEQALDQSLAFQEELRSQLAHQQFLETQLASTEEIANIQQQAITQLKQQLAQQRQLLAAHPKETQDQPLDNSSRPYAPSRLKEPLVQHHAASPDHHSPVQLSLLDQTNPPEVAQKLAEQEASIHQLETELHRAHIALQEQQALIDAFQSYTVRRSTGNLADSSLDGELFTAYCKIQELETQVSKQTTSQAMLQHTCQELEQVRDRHQSRITELEAQIAVMQEQILKQAQQSSEHETAVQHWKDRYQSLHTYLMQVKQLLEQTLPNPPAPIVELLAALQTLTSTSTEEPAAPPVSRSPRIDLPDFLIRRHRYRARP